MLTKPETTIAMQDAPAPVNTANPNSILIETRFGPIEFDRDNTIDMTQGLLGFPDVHEFALANLPDERFPQFKLLQCLTDPSLSFIVAPLNIESGAIQPADLDEACDSLDIAREDLAVLIVVSVRKDPTGIQVTGNLRAPVILDTQRQVGRQYVLANSAYPIRQEL